jgi:ketosteroid isomerase-like protein
MKLRLLLALVGLAISFAAPAFAQQTSTSVSDQDHQQIEDLIAKKLEEACNKNDAAAMAAIFTEDAVQVAPEGLFSCRQAIEKRYADVFQRTHHQLYLQEGSGECDR